MADDPTDAEIEAAILGAPAGTQQRLAAALDALLAAHGPRPSVEWSRVEGQMPFPRYPAEVTELVDALVDAGAQPVFDWMHWDGRGRLTTPDALATAPTADVARWLTCVIRGERFGDGVIAHALETGQLVVAAERIAGRAPRDRG